MARRAPATGGKPGRPKHIELDLEAREDHEVPNAPAGLQVDGLNTWHQLWKAGAHLDEDADYFLVSELCHLIDETAHMRRALAIGAIAGGVDRTYRQGKNGSIVIHPFVNQIKDNRAMIMSWMSQLGFGVLTRQEANAGGENDEMANYQKVLSEIREEIKNQK